MAMRKQDSFWIWGGSLTVLLLGAAVAVFWYQHEHTIRPTEPPEAAAAPTAAPAAPAPRPVEVAPPTEQHALPLPPLDQSDSEVQGGLAEVVGHDAISQFLVPERIVRNAVVTIDNLSREQAAVQQRPVKRAPGKFLVAGTEGSLTISPDNYKRYDPFVTAVKMVDAKTLVAFYRGMQPLFQQAYEDLGHPNGFFNTRLLEIIDHLLETPDVHEPIRLVQPSVVYKYADPKLENLSAGQKLLIRMGPENAGIIKAKLREIQAELL